MSKLKKIVHKYLENTACRRSQWSRFSVDVSLLFSNLIILHYRHSMVFRIAILYVSIQCVNSCLMALKDFKYVYSLDRKRQFTPKDKMTSLTKITSISVVVVVKLSLQWTSH